VRRTSRIRQYFNYGKANLRTRAATFNAAAMSQVWYVIEPGRWSVFHDGERITQAVRRLGIEARTTLTPAGVSRQVVHYGSRNLFLLSDRLKCRDDSRVVFTWFHGSEEDPSPENQRMIDAVGDASERADVIVTACRTSAARLIGWGVQGQKLQVVPLGVDTTLFRPELAREGLTMRQELGIPPDAMCVGSFQKDGVGWGKGHAPKYVKAPEVLVETLAALAKRRRVHVLLTGPARGFVKAGLDRAGVPYTHVEFDDSRRVAPYYHALDVYLITSRDEGGPKGFLEAAASGVPVVSTKVGMASDLIQQGTNGLLADVDDVTSLVDSLDWLANDRQLGERIAVNGRLVAQRHDWRLIGEQYADRVYRPLLGRESAVRRSTSLNAEAPNAG
jgi:glycosyltransferase involved in cell wall biosynthesis